MKKLMIVAILALTSISAQAGRLDKIQNAIKKTSSSGKLIRIYGTNNYGIDLADGSNISSDFESMVIANLLCDFSKTWQAQESTFICIAK